MRKAFQTDVAHMLYVRDGKLVDVPIPEFVRRTGERRTVGFTPAALVVDYMSLLKIDGEWRIVNKIFDRVPREGAAGQRP